jgi:hypothetical protein
MLLVIFQEAFTSVKELNESLLAELDQERSKALELVDKVKVYKFTHVNDSLTIYINHYLDLMDILGTIREHNQGIEA